MKSWIGKIVLGAGVLAATAAAQAQGYPSRPVRIIVPYAPGGTVDLVARVVAGRLSEQTGQSFVVENRAGASGAIGSEAVARAPADGYTLLVQSPTLIANALMSDTVPYDTAKDFTPISLLGSVPMLLAAHPSVPAANLKEFIDQARANPAKFTFGTSAVGSPMHVAEEAIKHDAKLDILVVPYKGTAPALNDLLGGQVSAIIDAIPSTYPHVASGKLKALAVTTSARLPSMPNVPTVAESGIPGFDMVTWYGLWGPAKLPDAVLKVLSKELATAMKAPLVTERLGNQGFIADGGSPASFAAFIDKERAMYTRVIKAANIQIK
ncbi:tripartite tricarboxylate transporter substrate binding protein [Pigmentiphaga sp. YJ18]|uniref:Bug family tripartite tricarboxylate transporter substrate binding protein n=1 Tax=Pigmentiphaga sp. YJ18 TaxID=3134907 RepID=UPI00310CCCF4